MTAQEINAARRSLAAFQTELAKFNTSATNVGRSAGKGFAKNFKTLAVGALKEVSKGALGAIGTRIVENWGKTGTRSGRSFGRRMKTAAASEVKSMSSGGGGGLNLGNFLKITGAAALGTLLFQQVKTSFDTAFEQEGITISLDALSADGSGGGRIFESIRKDALKTGVDVAAQAGVIRKLMAQGIGEDYALDLNRSMLDIAGATGLSTSEVELLGTALAQVKGKGTAAMEELRGQIAEKGVPIFEALRQSMGEEDVKGVFAAIAAGKVTAEQVLDTFKNLEGPFARFAGAAERMGKTGGGLVSRLKQEYTDLQRVFMEDVMPELKPALEYGITLIQQMKASASEFGATLAEALGTVQAAFEALSFAEMFALAGLALKEKLLEALDAGQKGAKALMAGLQDDGFGKMLERAALTFKQIMLEGASEIAAALATGAGGKTKTALENASHYAKGSAEVAAAQREALEAEGAGTPGDWFEKVKKEFKDSPSLFGLSDADRMEMERLLQKVGVQRDANVASRGGDAPIVEPASGGGGGTAAAFDPTGMLASGLSNAISKITGGGDILMTKQLATQEGTRAATEKTAVAAQKTQEAVEEIARNTNPRRRPDPRAALTL